MSSKAAAEMARARWKGTTKAERSAVGRMLHDAKMAATTPKQRTAIAKKAAAARWAKKKSKAKKK